ncbi:MAG: putative DNA binding protein [Natronomonas sp.]|jgi:predicted DNA binding protein|uniref:helix-turn-helix domain-containing protein n=1 Tax=Natronomonas sp. TaxID=2184060 RepID=UPI003989F16F
MISECLVVEFRVTGDDCPLAEASDAVSAPIDAAPPLLREDGYTLLRFSTHEAAVGDVLGSDDRIRYLHRTTADGCHTFRCLSKERCIVHQLIDEGFLVESVRYRDGDERHVGAVVGQDVLHGVLEAAGEAVGVRLERISPLGEEGETTVETRWNLTPGQAEALEAAHEMGYFEVPKGADAAAIAAELGVSKSAFLERLRRAQAALFDQVLA